jgi:hypothetical protein
MKKYYCNGKKDFCDRNRDCEATEEQEECKFFNAEGGEWLEEENEKESEKEDTDT